MGYPEGNAIYLKEIGIEPESTLLSMGWLALVTSWSIIVRLDFGHDLIFFRQNEIVDESDRAGAVLEHRPSRMFPLGSANEHEQ
jgi:hypothetical protein